MTDVLTIITNSLKVAQEFTTLKWYYALIYYHENYDAFAAGIRSWNIKTKSDPDADSAFILRWYEQVLTEYWWLLVKAFVGLGFMVGFVVLPLLLSTRDLIRFSPKWWISAVVFEIFSFFLGALYMNSIVKKFGRRWLRPLEDAAIRLRFFMDNMRQWYVYAFELKDKKGPYEMRVDADLTERAAAYVALQKIQTSEEIERWGSPGFEMRNDLESRFHIAKAIGLVPGECDAYFRCAERRWSELRPA